MAAAARSVELALEDGFWVGRFRAMAGPCEVLIETPMRRRRARSRSRSRTARGASSTSSAATAGTTSSTRSIQRRSRRKRRRGDREAARFRRDAPRPVGRALRHHLRRTASSLDIRRRNACAHAGGNRRTAATGRLGQGAMAPAEAAAAAGMQIDFGGIGKEYAVDQAVQIARNICGRGRPGQLRRRPRREPAARGRAALAGRDRGSGGEGPSGIPGARAAARRTRDQRRHTSLRPGDGTRYSHILDSAQRLARARRATLGHGRGRDLHAGRHADDARGAGRPQRRAISRG